MADKSPVTLVFEALRESPLLTSVGVAVYFGHDGQQTAPRRIVLHVDSGAYVFPEVNLRRNSAGPPLADVDLNMIARVWAEDHDEAWDIQRRFFQALYRNTTNGGPLYKHERPEWGSQNDSSDQGQELTIRFRLLLPIERIPETTAAVTNVQESTFIVNPATGAQQAGPVINIP